MRWLRRKHVHPPREGWVVLLDAEGREVGARIPVVVHGNPHEFTVEHSLTWQQFRATTVRYVRVIDADGVAHDSDAFTNRDV